MSNKNSPFRYQDPFPLTPDKTKYRLLDKKGLKVKNLNGKPALMVEPGALVSLARQATRDIAFLLRPKHLAQVAAILNDPEASANDKAVAWEILKNAVVSANFELPLCQDTGTAIVTAKKGERVWTGVNDAACLSKGIWQTYTKENLRYSQTVPLDTYEEKNSGNNMPAEITIQAVPGMEYRFLFIAKGGGSANKTYLFQETRALLEPETLKKFLIEKMKSLGTAACPPYHIAFVIGGTSAEACLKTVKLASTGYYDGLPRQGNVWGQALRDEKLENELLEASYKIGFGAQFGGKHFALDVRVIRLPRHGASCPVGMGVSCIADRNIKAKIDKNGLWLEELERNPSRFLPKDLRLEGVTNAIKISLARPMREILPELSKHDVGSRLALTGRLIVARDIAHAKLKERLVSGKGLPQYFKDHPVYYAGPAKTPAGKPSGSFGPTTSGRMDSYTDLFMSNGASLIMIGKGNRSPAVTEACKKHGGFYLGSIGGPAAILADQCIKKVEALDYPELGMEAVWAIDVVDFPAFILADDKGNDFFERIKNPQIKTSVSEGEKTALRI
ncbi:MAG: fumarate hydratase [Elusimicrobia bacterium]|nr:fumarate hydratase [Elusimicrobiota bacterium]